mgnify:CR=1 FL=1
MASLERGKPRSLQRDCVLDYQYGRSLLLLQNFTIDTPERTDTFLTLRPCFIQKDCFAGTGQAAFPTQRWLRRNGASRVPYAKMASVERAVNVPNGKMALLERTVHVPNGKMALPERALNVPNGKMALLEEWTSLPHEQHAHLYGRATFILIVSVG